MKYYKTFYNVKNSRAVGYIVMPTHTTKTSASGFYLKNELQEATLEEYAKYKEFRG